MLRLAVGAGEIIIDRNRITNTLQQECPYCGTCGCTYSCDQSTFEESEDQTQRIQFNAAIDGLESLLLALSQTMDVSTPEFVSAIDTALGAIADNYGEL